MVKEQIAKEIYARRADLLSQLSDNNLGLEKKHQIYGAVNEIDLFIKTMNYYEQEHGNNKITLVKPPEPRKPAFSKVLDDFKKKVKR